MQDKRIALVTGANQGVGRQVAKELVANGLTVPVGSVGPSRDSQGNWCHLCDLDLNVPSLMITHVVAFYLSLGHRSFRFHLESLLNTGRPRP